MSKTPGPDDGTNVIELEKTYPVRLTEREMAAVARCMTAYFNRLTTEKKSVPVDIAVHVQQSLQKMKAACEGAGIILAQ